MSCAVCAGAGEGEGEKPPAKYKCPACREPYCSVPCYKKHKETPCSPPPETDQPPDVSPSARDDYVFPTEDTVPVEKLKLLEQSTGLKNCLLNPHLRTILESLDKCEHPDAMIKHYMQEPIFTELVDECLKVVCDDETLD